jgi:hypothetical protein
MRFKKLPKSDKGIRDLKACLDYSYHHARSCEFEFLLSHTANMCMGNTTKSCISEIT